MHLTIYLEIKDFKPQSQGVLKVTTTKKVPERA